MSEGSEEGSEPGGTSVRMECGHRIRLPWGVPPAAAVAELLHHRGECSAATAQDRPPLFELGLRPAQDLPEGFR